MVAALSLYTLLRQGTLNTSTTSIRGKIVRAGVEFFIIVAGVMVALAGDAWRESRGEAAQERRYLIRIAAELEASLRSLSRARLGLDNVTKHGLAAAPYLRGDSVAANPVLVLAAAYQASRAVFPTINDDVYEEMVSRNGLNLIRDDSLRSSISAYYRRVDRGPLPGIVITDNIAYRNAIRSVIPMEIQVVLRRDCPMDHEPLTCSPAVSPTLSRRAMEHIVGERSVERALNLWLSSVSQEQTRIEELERRTTTLLEALNSKLKS